MTTRGLGEAFVLLTRYCGAAPRHRLLKLRLVQEWAAQHPGPVDILHFAPEWGTERSLRLSPRVGRYVTADLAAPGVDVQCDITALDFPDASFDVVLCSHVLEHVPDDRRAVSEIHRVLRPGGVAYIQVPWDRRKHTDEDPSVTAPAERAQRFGQFDHVRMYGADLVDRLRAPGFHVEELRPVQGMSAGDVARWGLWDDVIFRCEVRGAAPGTRGSSRRARRAQTISAERLPRRTMRTSQGKRFIGIAEPD